MKKNEYNRAHSSRHGIDTRPRPETEGRRHSLGGQKHRPILAYLFPPAQVYLSLNSSPVVLHPHPHFLILWDALQGENPQRSGANSTQYWSLLYAYWPRLTYSVNKDLLPNR